MGNQQLEVNKTDSRISVGVGEHISYSVDLRNQRPTVIVGLVTFFRGLAVRLNPQLEDRMPSVEETLKKK